MLTNSFAYAASGETRLLLNFNGTNGSTTFIDSSAYNWTATPFATAQLSTAIKKNGSASLYLPVNHDYIQLPYQVGNFGAQDFCVEGWVYPVTKAGNGGIFQWNLNYAGFCIQWNGTIVKLLVGNATTNGWAHNVNGTTTVQLNQWTHLAVTRQGQILRFFINGILEITINAATTIFPDTTTPFNIGGFGNNFGVGYYDTLRIVRGYAVYTTNFTPPPSEF